MNRDVCQHFNPVDQECRECAAEPQTTHWEGCEEVHPECKMVKQAVQAEREACARMCEAYMAEGIGREMAAAIRSRT